MVKELAPEEVKARLEADALRIIDTRSPEQFAQGHIPGAINVPLHTLPSTIPELEWDDTDVVCVCPIGESSKQAATLINSYEAVDEETLVASMAGGYADWEFTLTAEDTNTDS